MTNQQHRDGSSTNIANYTFTYDNQSRLTTEVKNGNTVTYAYDNTDQLTADGTVTVTYDANGNRNNGSYTVGTGNRITSDGTWTYTYDDEGNLKKKSQGASALTWTYGYDQKNQLIQVTRSQTDGGAVDRQMDFKYDPFGNRIEQSYDADGAGGGGATVTRFAYDGWKNPNQHFVGNENWDVWADLDGGSSLTTRYMRGDVIDQIFARRDSGTTYWTLGDRLGSVRDVVNNAMVVKDSITYNGFGGITSETDSSFRGRYAWTGREINTEIELQYNRARYYNAGTGRWISEDPLGFDAGDSNLYRYVRNEHSTVTDPSGFLRVIHKRHRVFGEFAQLDGAFVNPKYTSMATKYVEALNTRVAQSAGVTLALGNPARFELLTGWNAKEHEYKGVKYPAKTIVAGYWLIALEWDVCLEKKDGQYESTDNIGIQIKERGTQKQTKDGASQEFPWSRDARASLNGDEFTALMEFKVKQDGATHRIVTLDAPGTANFSTTKVDVRTRFTQSAWLTRNLTDLVPNSEFAGEVEFMYTWQDLQMAFYIAGGAQEAAPPYD